MKKNNYSVEYPTYMDQYLTDIEYDFIVRCLQQGPTVHSILDIGGGKGRFALPLQGKGYQVTVTEVGRRLLKHVKSHNPNIEGVLTDQNSCGLPIRDASVDCVLAIGVPIILQSWFWQECYRVLKPDGIVVVSWSNGRSYKGLLYKLRWALKPFLSSSGKDWASRGDFYHLSTQTIVQMLEEERLQLCAALGYNWLPVGRGANNSWLSLFGTLEQKFGLRNLAFLSPWVILKAQKSG